MMIERIVLTRGHAFEMGTFGTLSVGEFSCKTCERPWLGNTVSESCVPPGVYPLRLRRSEVVRRASGGRHADGWEVQDAPGRTYIMIHPGNTIDDSEGCILPGESFSAWSGKWAVTNSKDVFEALMRTLSARDEWLIEIRYFLPEYP